MKGGFWGFSCSAFIIKEVSYCYSRSKVTFAELQRTNISLVEGLSAPLLKPRGTYLQCLESNSTDMTTGRHYFVVFQMDLRSKDKE